jgi:hypothetical protein
LKNLIKIYLVVALLFVFSGLSAQTRYQQFTIGGGAGAATAFAGADIIQTNPAFYASACYYPMPVFNIDLEGQLGTLSGDPAGKGIDLKGFTNNYKAVILDANLHLGAFFDPEKNGFLNVLKNFYGGLGYGVMNNSVSNIYILNTKTTNHVTNTLHMIAFDGGYECNILRNKYNEPLLKASLSLNLYDVPAKGLDGYYDNYARAYSYYTYYSVGLKYTIIIKAPYGKGYNKFD